MTVRPPDGPLSWNVAGLLTDVIGATRVLDVTDVRPSTEEFDLAEPIAGRIRLTRTNRGILVAADLTVTLAVECSRCLRPTTLPLALTIKEEVLPALDLASGVPLDTEAEPDALRLTDHHELDLETTVLEAIVMAEPIAPLCRPDCPGLCPTCGGRLDEGSHVHPDDDIDPRLAALQGFAVDDE